MAMTARWTRVHTVVLAFLMVTALLVAPPHDAARGAILEVNPAVTCGTPPQPYCTIQSAVAAAAPGDTILVHPGNYLEAVNVTGKNLIIESVGGASVTTITATPSTSNAFHANDATVTLRGFTLTGANRGVSNPGGGVWLSNIFTTVTIEDSIITGNQTANDGGGIASWGNLTLIRTTVVGNQAANGGGISSDGTTELQQSTIENNTATAWGGGIYHNENTLAIPHTILIKASTIADNVAQGTYGGGLAVHGGSADIVNTTISLNSASFGGGVYAMAPPISTTDVRMNNTTIAENIVTGHGGGIGIDSAASVQIANTIITDNVFGANSTTADCSGGTLTIDADSVVGKPATVIPCTFAGAGSQLTGTTNLTGTLADNGGPTLTYLPAAGTVMLDAGSAAAPGSGYPACEPVDQRGVTRPQNGQCDIGSVEVEVSSTPLQDLIDANPGTVIVVPPGTYTETITIGGGTTLQGGGATPADVVIDGGGAGSTVTAGTGDFTLENLTVTGGSASGITTGTTAHAVILTDVVVTGNANPSGNGGGVHVNGLSSLVATNTEFSGNSADPNFGFGGAVYVASGGSANVDFATFSGNQAAAGGAIAADGFVAVFDTGFVGNTATVIGDGGAVYQDTTPASTFVRVHFEDNFASTRGGALFVGNSITMRDSSFVNNLTDGDGGGLFLDGNANIINTTFSGNAANEGGAIFYNGNPAQFNNLTVANNTANNGGGLWAEFGAFNIANSVIANNTSSAGTPPNCNALASSGYNFISDGTLCTGTIASDSVGTDVAPIDPLLGILIVGPTSYRELQPGSPLIDAANPGATGLNAFPACQAIDQIGTARPQGAGCDIGAIEVVVTAGPLQTIINNTPDNGVALAPAGTYNESITLGRGVTLQGDGAGETIISGDGESTVVVVDGSATIRDLTVTGGGIGIDVFTEVAEDVLIDSVQVHGNNSAGIAVFDQPSVRIINSTIGPLNGSGITAVSDHADGYAVEVINSTISGNNGSGFYADAGSFVGPKYLLDHVTITDNTGGSFEAGVVVEDTDNVELYLRNSIVAGNAPNDCDTQVEDIISLGRNVVGENNFCGTWLSTDLVGPVGIDPVPIDPGLGDLADNGGTTLTHALLSGSPAIDHAFKSSGFTSFGGSPKITTNGSAALVGGALRLTNAGGQAGSAFWQQPVLLDGNGFATTFTFQITNPQPWGGAPNESSGDGLTFVIAPSPTALGAGGGSIGIGEVADTVVVEFDSFSFQAGGFPNSDPDGGPTGIDHVGIDIDGNMQSSTVFDQFNGNFDDGAVWTATITYDGTTNLLDVEVTNGTVTGNVSTTVDIASVIGDGDPTQPAYFGFSSGTGAASATHSILAWAGTIQGQCPATDQRGLARPAGPACDAGAFELASIIPTELTVAIAAAGSLAVGSPVIPIEDLNVGTFFGVPTGPAASQLGAIQLGAIQLGAIQLGAIGSDLSTPFGHVSIQAIIDAAAELSDVTTILDQITLVDLPVVGGWDQYIPNDSALSPLAGRPDYTITLQQAIDDPVMGPILPTLRLADSGVSASQLGAIQLGAIQLGAIQLGAIPLDSTQLGAIEAQLQEVCQPAGDVDCVTLGIDPNDGATAGAYSLMALSLLGIDISFAQLGAIDPTSAQLGAIQLGAIQLGAITVQDAQLGAIQLGAIDWNDPVQAQLGAIQLGAIQLGAIQLGAIDPAALTIGNTQLGAIQLGAIQLGAIQLGAIDYDPARVPSGNKAGLVSYWCGSTGGLDCEDLGVVEPPGGYVGDELDDYSLVALGAMGAQLGAIQLGAIQLGAIGDLVNTQLGAIQLGAIDIENSQLGAILLSDTQLGAIQLGAIDWSEPAFAQLGAIQLGAIQLGAIENGTLVANQLGAIQLGAIADPTSVVSCGALAGGCAANGSMTLFELDQLGVFLASATLADLAEALEGIPLSALELETGSPLSLIVDATIAALLPDTTVAELPPDLTLGDIWELWAGITFFELLLALLNPADLNWEDVDPAAIAADHPSLVVGWSTIFELAGEPGLVPGAEFPFTAEAVVVLPEGVSYVPGSANLLTNPTALPATGDPLPDPSVEGNTLTWIIDGVTLNDVLHVQYTLATAFTADTSTPVSTTVNTLGFTGADAAPTFVFDVEPNDTFLTATEVSGDVLVLGKMGTPTDVDMFRMTVPPGGSIEAYLNPGGVDLDLVLFEPNSNGDEPLRGTPERVVDGSLDPVIGIDPTEQDQESLDDIANVDLAPVFKASLHRSSANERIITPPLRNGGEYFLQITSYNQEPSNATYVSRIRVIPPPAASVCAARTYPAISATMPAIPAGVQTLYLMHTDLFAATNSAADLAAVEAAIAAINPTNVAGAPIGVVIPVQADPTVNTAYQAWFASDGNCSVDAANDVARAIANLVDDLRANHPTLESVVIIGGDDQVPFFRVKDQATVANERSYASTFAGNNPLKAALRDGFILSDSPYTDANPLYVPAGDREVFVTQMAIGRLVETPAEIVASLNQYVASGGALNTAVPAGAPDPLARVLGYDFLADSSVKIRDLLDVRYAVISNINETWTKTDLVNAMDSGAAIVNFNAHQDHTGALPAAGNIANETDLSAVFTDLYTVDDLQGIQNSDGSVNTLYAGTLIFGMGCHGGTNAPASYLDPSDDTYDWAQALLARRAILIANTGFGYGDTDVVAYSEELMTIFSEQIAISNTVGEAWLRAGQVFTAQTPKWSPYHDKALMEATLYGLPFYRLHDVPVTPPPIATVGTSPDLGVLESASVIANDPLTLQPLTPTEGEFYEGDDVLALPFRPIQPLDVIGVTPDTAGLRATGAIVEALSSTDLPGFDVLFARPVLYDGLVEPEFETLGPFPNSIQAISSSETPDGRTDNLLLARGRYTPGPDGTLGTQQLFDSVQMTVYYAPDSVTDVDPPNITRVVANETALGNVVFEVDAEDASGILRVVVLYKVAGANGAWTKVELGPAGGVTWTGTAGVSVANADLDYTVQVLGGDGLTVWSTDKAELHPVLPPAPPAIQLAGTLGNNGIYRSSVGVTIADPANAPLFPVEYSTDGGTTFTTGSSFTLPDDGTFELVARPEGFPASESTRMVVIDQTAPTVNVTAPGNPVVVGLNGTLPLKYFCTDAQSGIAKCEGTVPNGQLLDTSVPGPHEAQVTGTDKAGNTTKVLVPYEVLEVPDLVHTADLTVVAINTVVTFTVEYGATGGDHEVVWDFGDGNSTTLSAESGPTSTATNSYLNSGVYPVMVTVTHGDDLVQTNTIKYIVVYDPAEGFVTGGGWFYSPAGAFTPSDPFDTDYMGKAEFGFNAKYKKGATVPTGNTAFEFATAGFEFHSTSYEWLVVQGDAKASYKGVGVITGREDEGSFQFMVVIRDADVNQNDAFTKDSFRIKIWKELADGTEVVEYDNGYGQDLNSETGGTTELGGGSIQIHVPKAGGKK